MFSLEEAQNCQSQEGFFETNRLFCSAAYIQFQGLSYGQYSMSKTAGTVSSSGQTGS